MEDDELFSKEEELIKSLVCNGRMTKRKARQYASRICMLLSEILDSELTDVSKGRLILHTIYPIESAESPLRKELERKVSGIIFNVENLRYLFAIVEEFFDKQNDETQIIKVDCVTFYNTLYLISEIMDGATAEDFVGREALFKRLICITNRILVNNLHIYSDWINIIESEILYEYQESEFAEQSGGVLDMRCELPDDGLTDELFSEYVAFTETIIKIIHDSTRIISQDLLNIRPFDKNKTIKRWKDEYKRLFFSNDGLNKSQSFVIRSIIMRYMLRELISDEIIECCRTPMMTPPIQMVYHDTEISFSPLYLQLQTGKVLTHFGNTREDRLQGIKILVYSLSCDIDYIKYEAWAEILDLIHVPYDVGLIEEAIDCIEREGLVLSMGERWQDTIKNLRKIITREKKRFPQRKKQTQQTQHIEQGQGCLLYTSPSPRD